MIELNYHFQDLRVHSNEICLIIYNLSSSMCFKVYSVSFSFISTFMLLIWHAAVIQSLDILARVELTKYSEPFYRKKIIFYKNNDS